MKRPSQRSLSVEGSNFGASLRFPFATRVSDVVGKHRLDLIVEDAVIVELKAVKDLNEIHQAVVLSYLAATGLSVALLLNFSKPSLEYRRIIR
ncbi:MAG: GxxExxY protein [Bacillota bacterium]